MNSRPLLHKCLNHAVPSVVLFEISWWLFSQYFHYYVKATVKEQQINATVAQAEMKVGIESLLTKCQCPNAADQFQDFMTGSDTMLFSYSRCILTLPKLPKWGHQNQRGRATRLAQAPCERPLQCLPSVDTASGLGGNTHDASLSPPYRVGQHLAQESWRLKGTALSNQPWEAHEGVKYQIWEEKK